MLRVEFDGAIDRLTEKLVGDTSSTTKPVDGEEKQPGARRVITLDGNTYIVAKLPDGVDETDAEKLEMQVRFREGTDASKDSCVILSQCGCQFKF